MAYDISDLIEGVRAPHRFFLRHLDGLREDQWDWKPYPECKSIRETIVHLINDDRAFVHYLDTGREPDYASLGTTEQDLGKLLALLDESHEKLCKFLMEKFGNAPLDTKVAFYGGEAKLPQAILGISSEYCYHQGQVAFIRMATDPSWDYYKHVYGHQDG